MDGLSVAVDLCLKWVYRTSLLLLIRMSNCRAAGAPPSFLSLAKVWNVNSCARAAHFISYLQYGTVCITKQVLTIYFFFFFFGYKDFKSSPVDFFASLSVATEGKALYCHSACNKERMKTQSRVVYVIVFHSLHVLHHFLPLILPNQPQQEVITGGLSPG